MTAARAPSGVEIIQRPKEVEASLWRRLRFGEDLSCREKLFSMYHDAALRIAISQYRRRPAYGLEIADFKQLAFSGLLEAIDKFDPVRGIPFLAYAKHRIKGTISDGISRSSEQSAFYTYRQNAERDRVQSLEPDGAHADDALAQVIEIAVGLALGLILEKCSSQKESGHKDAYETLEWRDLQARILREIENLPPQEMTIIKHHYISDLAFVQIAKMTSLSKGRVSQIHKSALLHLRDRLKSYR